MAANGIIIMDFDDVLVDLSTAFYKRVRAHWTVFSRWLVDAGPLTKEQLRSREIFSITDWLLKAEFKNMSSKEFLEESLLLREAMKKFIFNDTLYNETELTDFAKETLLNELYIRKQQCQKSLYSF